MDHKQCTCYGAHVDTVVDTGVVVVKAVATGLTRGVVVDAVVAAPTGGMDNLHKINGKVLAGL